MTLAAPNVGAAFFSEEYTMTGKDSAVVEIVAFLARRPVTSPFGKCTEEVKALIPSDVKVDLVAAAAAAGKTISEYLRDRIFMDLYGEDDVLERMRAQLLGVGQETARKR